MLPRDAICSNDIQSSRLARVPEHMLPPTEEEWIGRVIGHLNDSLLTLPMQLESRLKVIREQALAMHLSASK